MKIPKNVSSGGGARGPPSAHGLNKMNVNVNVNLWSLLNLSVSLMLTDIDVMEPDEKSIVTYVSLLYDIFPNVPSLEQSLRDNVSYTSVSYY